EVLFRRYAESQSGEPPLLTRMLYRKGANIHDCFDVAQAVQLDFYQTHFADFDPEKGSLLPFLSRSAQWVWAKMSRKNRPELAPAVEQIDPSPSLLEGMVAREMLERVNAAIDALPPGERETMQLQRDENLTAMETAERLKVPVKQVYRWNYSAR